MMLRVAPEKPCFMAAAAAVLIVGAFVVSSVVRSSDRGLLCSLSPPYSGDSFSGGMREQLSSALVRYATTTVVPQQSFAEISVSLAVIRRRCPCNFLVFGLGRDSQMWAALNAGGTTVFLEEDQEWYKSVLKISPELRAHYVKYRTRLDEADRLLKIYKTVPECRPAKTWLKGNEKCKLALNALPAEIYEREWDLVMIDAPKGYFAAAPGRMAAIFSAAVMGRRRRGEGVTDVFLHDVDRRIEKTFAEEFLCKKNLVGRAGRLWHFVIPPLSANRTAEDETSFC